MADVDRISPGKGSEPSETEEERGTYWQRLIQVVGTGALGIAVLAGIAGMAIVVGLIYWPEF